MAKQARRTTSRSDPAGGGAPPLANQLLRFLPRAAADLIKTHGEDVELELGESLFEPGDDVSHVHFPIGRAVVSLLLPMRDGHAVEAATIGREGAVGGIISMGHKPAFARAAVQIEGPALRVPIRIIEAAKRAAPKTHDVLARYGDCLTAQAFQSVGCAALHPLESRCARWLLMTHDRLQQPDLPLTQEALAEMLGVARTYVTRIASALQESGAISYRRGVITIVKRRALEATACECYATVRQHFERILPGLYPGAEP